MSEGASNTAELIRIRPARLIEDAPAYAEEPSQPFTRVKLAWFLLLGLGSWFGLGVMLWGFILFLRAVGV
jgi:hypothetical protein